MSASVWTRDGPEEKIPLYYGERNIFQVNITYHGSPGHGSRFLENTAGEKAQKVINKLLEFRAQEKARLESNPDLTLGDVTTVNLTLSVFYRLSLFDCFISLFQDGGWGPG